LQQLRRALGEEDPKYLLTIAEKYDSLLHSPDPLLKDIGLDAVVDSTSTKQGVASLLGQLGLNQFDSAAKSSVNANITYMSMIHSIREYFSLQRYKYKHTHGWFVIKREAANAREWNRGKCG
jgi:hypothetical protein